MNFKIDRQLARFGFQGNRQFVLSISDNPAKKPAVIDVLARARSPFGLHPCRTAPGSIPLFPVDRLAKRAGLCRITPYNLPNYSICFSLGHLPRFDMQPPSLNKLGIAAGAPADREPPYFAAQDPVPVLMTTTRIFAEEKT
jgi:hypothetical protein